MNQLSENIPDMRDFLQKLEARKIYYERECCECGDEEYNYRYICDYCKHQGCCFCDKSYMRKCVFCEKYTCEWCLEKTGRFDVAPIHENKNILLYKGDHDQCEYSSKNKRILLEASIGNNIYNDVKSIILQYL